MSWYSMELTDREKAFAGQFSIQADTFAEAFRAMVKQAMAHRTEDKIWVMVITCTKYEPTQEQQAEMLRDQIRETSLKLEGLRDQLKRLIRE